MSSPGFVNPVIIIMNINLIYSVEDASEITYTPLVSLFTRSANRFATPKRESINVLCTFVGVVVFIFLSSGSDAALFCDAAETLDGAAFDCVKLLGKGGCAGLLRRYAEKGSH